MRAALSKISLASACIVFIFSNVTLAVAAGPTDDLCWPDQSLAGQFGRISEMHMALPGMEQRGLGCALSKEQDIPNADGRYVDFQNGQIIWSRPQLMSVAAYVDRNAIHVTWKVVERYHYDFFRIITQVDNGDATAVDVNAATGGTSGTATLPLSNGRHAIYVAGCDGPSSIPPQTAVAVSQLSWDRCSSRQGFSAPLLVDVWPIDVVHAYEKNPQGQYELKPLLPARTPAEAQSSIDQRILAGFIREACDPSWSFKPGGKVDERYAYVALAKLHLSTLVSANSRINICPDDFGLRGQVNDALRGATPATEVGTSVGPLLGLAGGAGMGAIIGSVVIPGVGIGTALGALIGGGAGAADCSRDGDYDMALNALIQIAYRYRQSLDPDVYRHLLYDQAGRPRLLNQSGGNDSIRFNVPVCGVTIPETENHVMMTESARYLTNQLLLEDVLLAHRGDPQSPEVAQAKQMYCNVDNGLQSWMIDHLRGFLKHDFHEYNARPYSRLTIYALHNLVEFDRGASTGCSRPDPDRPVGTLANMLLDYLAAKFAVSSSGLRRAAPFRRRWEHRDYAPLFGNASDEETWWFVTMSGATDTLKALRYGRADWGSGPSLSLGAVGGYRLQNLVLDLLIPHDGRKRRFLQAFRHEGIEVYASNPEFLISAGGAWRDITDRERTVGPIPGISNTTFGDPAFGVALPTTLMPGWEGTDRSQLIRIDGHKDEKKRSNTCVEPGFACGVNPVVPDYYLLRYLDPVRYGRCNFYNVGHRQDQSDLIWRKWNDLGGQNGLLGCPVGDVEDFPEGQSQDFFRGQIVWSKQQKMVVAAYQKPGSRDFVLEWKITDQYSYDKFSVVWDKDGQHSDDMSKDVQADDPNASPTGGAWNVPNTGYGKYSMKVEGITTHTFGRDDHNEGFTTPVTVQFPAAASCATGVGFWTFINAGYECGAPLGQGFFVAVYSHPCESDACRDMGDSFGFFGAIGEQEAPTGLAESGFANFQIAVLRANGNKEFKFDTVNEYQTSDGRLIRFEPRSGRSGANAISFDGLAKGDIIEADGKGCVVIRNPAPLAPTGLTFARTSQTQVVLKWNVEPITALVLDARDDRPIRRIPTVARDGLSCENVDPPAGVAPPPPPASWIEVERSGLERVDGWQIFGSRLAGTAENVTLTSPELSRGLFRFWRVCAGNNVDRTCSGIAGEFGTR